MDLGNTHARTKEWSITSHYFRFELIIESKNICRNATLVWAHMYVTRCWWYLSIRNVYMLSTEDGTYGSLMQTGVSYANIDCSRGEWWKIVVPKMKFNLGWLFTEAGSSSRPRLNFTEGRPTIIFYHSVHKKAVNVCFILPIHRFFKSVPNRTIWKVGYRVPNSAAVAVSSRVREIVKKNTHGLVSKHEPCQK